MSQQIVAAGCAFAAGPCLALADIAVRTHTRLTMRHPHYVDACGTQVKGAFFAARPPPEQRWLALADAALRDLATHLPAALAAHFQARAVPLWLVLGDASRPGRPAGLEVLLSEALAVQWPQVHIVRGGHAACAQALLAAQTWMTAQARPAVVLAIDSAWPADTLAWLEAQDLLHGAHRPYRGQARANPYGRIPAEGAAALLLAPPGMAPAWCSLAGLGLADEPLTFNTDGPCVGAGLTAAVHAALAAAEERSSPLGRHAIASLIHDANGEPYRADEFGFTALRLADHLAEGWQRLTPVLASGDLICASLATHLAIAAWRLRPSTSPATPAGPTLVLASSDDPARAAVLLSALESP